MVGVVNQQSVWALELAGKASARALSPLHSLVVPLFGALGQIQSQKQVISLTNLHAQALSGNTGQSPGFKCLPGPLWYM